MRTWARARARARNEDKEVLTTNNKDSPNEQVAGQADAPRQKPE